MKYNKKIFFLFLLLCLIIPQAIYAGDVDDLSDAGNYTRDNSPLTISSTYQSSTYGSDGGYDDKNENIYILDKVSDGDKSKTCCSKDLSLDNACSMDKSSCSKSNSACSKGISSDKDSSNLSNTYLVSENNYNDFNVDIDLNDKLSDLDLNNDLSLNKDLTLNLNSNNDMDYLNLEEVIQTDGTLTYEGDLDQTYLNDESLNQDVQNDDSLNKNDLKSPLSDENTFNIFIISDNTGNNLFDAVACEILDNSNFSNVKFNIRSGNQINAMSEDEIYELMAPCDAFIGQWVSSNVDAVLTSLLNNHPELSNKKLFLILEPPTGNINSSSSSLNLVRNSTIDYKKIFNGISNDDLINYFKATKRGNNFESIQEYIDNEGSSFNSIFNNLVLYKDINDKANLKNELLYILYLLGHGCSYESANFTGVQASGIFRDRWYSFDEYVLTFFNESRNRTIGILESTMYIQSQQLDLVNEITERLESKGYNVIPIYCPAGNAEQLNIMVKYWTSACSNISGFLENPQDFDIYVDGIISMVAYGVGGENFTNATKFFEDANVPIFRAVHSEYITNEQWELSPVGLSTTKSDKWWHVTIAESQGIFDATYVGGVDSYISNRTGAIILTFVPVHENIELLTDRVDAWVDLKYTPNEDKNISIVYYNYPPGKQNIGASYLDAITSVYNMLYTLKDEGYYLTDLPNNVSELEDMMIACGINVANWAPGEVEKLANRSGVALLPVDEYLEWFDSLDDIVKVQITEGPVAYIGQMVRRAVLINYTDEVETMVNDWYNQIKALLPENQTVAATNILDKLVNSLKLYANASSDGDENASLYYDEFLRYYDEFKSLNVSGLNGWGEAPGNIMLVNRNGTDYFVIPGLTFGNVFIGPEPQRGWEADIENLYHCTAVAPTHQYLAAYYYMQTRQSNAMVFVGRHATHEWLPGKEVLLSYNDYGSIVVGKVPQVYFYITDGLAEAIQAKRRGFAVLISHLDSPKSYTHLYGNLTVLATLLEEYDNNHIIIESDSDKDNQAITYQVIKDNQTITYQVINQELEDNLTRAIKDLVIANNYYLTIGFTAEELNNTDMFSLSSTLNAFLKNTQNTLYPLGLHAIGQKWTDEDLANTVAIIVSHDFEYGGKKTNLFDQLSLYYYGEKYSNLTPLKRDYILNRSVDVCKALIYWDTETVSDTIGIGSPEFIESLNIAKKYIDLYNQCISLELEEMVSALNGGYVPVNIGGESVTVPQVLPTGANMYQDQSSELPTQKAWDYAKTLSLLTLADLNDTTEKIIMGIWCVETARDDGALVSTVLYLLGMEPVWHNSSSAGFDEEGIPTGKKVEDLPNVIALENLTRPDGWAKKRIDVTVITSGLFRDLYSSQARLMDNAYRMALACSYYTIVNNKTIMDSEYGPQVYDALRSIMRSISFKGMSNESLEDNYVAKHWLEDCIYYLSLGYNSTVSGEYAITRIFAPPNGDYGAGISKLVSMSWTWNDTDELSEFYIGRMGNMYSKYYWGDTNPVVFMRALSDTDHIVVSRNTNQYGVLDNDDFFDYWGGLSMTVEYLSNKTPTMNVLMYANKDNAYVATFENVFYNELNTRYLNPEWIKGMMQEGYSGSRYMSNKFISNLWGWQVTRPSSVSETVWDDVYNTYYKDKYGLGVKSWLQSGNNAYSLISMSGTMLNSAYSGYWDADDATLSDIANTWAQATVANGVACCDCSCGNVAMMQWAFKYVNADLLAKLMPKLYDATQNPLFYTNSSDMPTNSSNIDRRTTNSSAESNNTETVQTNSSSNSQQSANGNTNIPGASGGYMVGTEADAQSDMASDSDAGMNDANGEGRSVEVTKSTSTPVAPKDVSMPIAIIVCVICLVALIGFGYFRNRKDDDDYYNDDDDDDYEYK
ncbi:magnesium chelatase H subunit BchH [Methanobrevibacter ruminantium M1]|uniref:Magnesium chelatase H subunit BchH n=2 Tax=Methanobrevibacter TaxID=2172 RepID=D3E0S3_METRM|nr:cobaltochelatase subunit CobN [Methanobrevibacter ruminantium]ADC47897.1 magnesium chelatase H subunit BchH [Methanobrevibacter ruminantium M1]